MTRRTILAGLFSVAVLPWAVQAESAFAGKRIQILVGFAPGGSTDILARTIAEAMGPDLQANVIVVNKPGANGNIAAAEVARAAPDGLTLYMGSFNNPVNHAAKRKLPFDFLKDFASVATVGYLPNVLVVNKALQANSVAELIELAKQRSKSLAFGSSGAGSSQHMAGELFKYQAKVDLVHVPYNGSPAAMNDVIGGHIDLLFDNIPTAAVQAKAGTVKALAVTGNKRAPQLPDIPTVAETPGLEAFDVTSFFALYAPASTPPQLVSALNASVNKALQQEKTRTSMMDKGIEPGGGSPEQLRALVEGEVAKWAEVIQASGIKFED